MNSADSPAGSPSPFVFNRAGSGARWKRASLEFKVAVEGDYEVGFGVTTGSRPTHQVTIGAPMLETLPNGIQTEVGERGGRLSMGQRQLVALMRVLMQKPAIFILDEATASIDPFTEWQIQQALNLILKNSTSILIAHRLSTVKAADRIVVMEKGTIIEEGNHEGLLTQGGHYATLYNTYFRHQSPDYKIPGIEEELAQERA